MKTTTYYLLPTTYYLLPTAYYLLPTTYYLLPTTYDLPLLLLAYLDVKLHEDRVAAVHEEEDKGLPPG